MSDNISLKKLLLPNGNKSEQYLKSGLNVRPYIQANKNIVTETPSWLLMGAQYYEEDTLKKDMKNNDIHNEFTDFIVDVARYQGNHIHNKFNEKIYNDIYLNWNNLDDETRNYYDSFLGLYKKVNNNDYKLVKSYSSLPSNVYDNEYKMKFNMSGGSTLFGKLLPSLSSKTENIWYTNSEGRVVSESKQSTNDLKSIYTCLFMNADQNICKKYALKLPVIAGGSNEGFSIDIYAAADSYIQRINNKSNILEGGNSIFDNELIFNNYFLKSVLNEHENNVSSCVSLLKNNNLDSTGKVDMEVANDALNKLGFSQEDGVFEPVSSWKNKSEDIIKNNELIDLMNSDSNISVLSHLGKIVNYVNYKNKMKEEPIVMDSTNGRSIEGLGLQSDWIPEFLEKTNDSVLNNLDVDKLYNDISTKGYAEQSGGLLMYGAPTMPPKRNQFRGLTPKLLPPMIGPVAPGLLPHPYVGGPLPLMPGPMPGMMPGMMPVGPMPGMMPGPIMTTFPGPESPPKIAPFSILNPFTWFNPFGPSAPLPYQNLTMKQINEVSENRLRREGKYAANEYLDEMKGYNIDLDQNFRNFVFNKLDQCKKNENVGCVRNMLELLTGIAHIAYVLKKNNNSDPSLIQNILNKKVLSTSPVDTKWNQLDKLRAELSKNIDNIITQIKNSPNGSNINANITSIYSNGSW